MIIRRGSTISAIAPAGKSEQEHRQRRRRVHERHVQRIEVERRHQPARRRIIHRDADERARARRPDDRERGMGESAEPARRILPRALWECGSPSSNVPRGAWTERLVGNESAAFGPEQQVPRHPAEGPLAQTAVPERARHDQIDAQASSRSLQAARPRLRSAATPRQFVSTPCRASQSPTSDSRSRAASISRSSDEFDDVDAFARLQDRQGVDDRPARLAQILPANQGARQLQSARAGRRNENRASRAHQEIADIEFGRGEEYRSPISAWATIKSTARARSATCWEDGPAIICGRHWRSFTSRQGGAELRLDRGGALAKFLEVAAPRLARANRHDGGMRRGLPCDDADDGGGKALRHVGDDQEQLGVRPVHSHAGHQDGNRRQTSLPGRIVHSARRYEQDQRIGRWPRFYARTCPNIATGTQIQKLVRLRAANSPRLGRKTRTARARPFLSGAPGTGREFVTVLTRRRDRSNKIYRPARPLRVGVASHGPLRRLENSPLVRHLRSGSVAFPPSNS